MRYCVSITPTGRRSVDALRGKARKSFDVAVERLSTEGCAAGDYRLTGEGIEHICALHLYGLYRRLGLREPTPKRTKPPCCAEGGKPSVDPELHDHFAATAKELTSRRRRV